MLKNRSIPSASRRHGVIFAKSAMLCININAEFQQFAATYFSEDYNVLRRKFLRQIKQGCDAYGRVLIVLLRYFVEL